MNSASGRPLTEQQLAGQVESLLRLYGWRSVHHWLSVRSAPGWPDYFCLQPERGQVLALELKSERGKLTPQQAAWLADLRACGVPALVVRPADLPRLRAVLAGEHDTLRELAALRDPPEQSAQPPALPW